MDLPSEKKYAHADIPVVILCGGKGTRLREETEIIPKPLVRIGNLPILVHIMKIYNHYGFRRFILPAGYKSEKIKEYFLNYKTLQSDFTISYTDGGYTLRTYENTVDPWEITVIDTGVEAETGSRLFQVQQYIDSDTFMLTYGDGVADVDIDALLRFHRGHGLAGTMTGVYPPARFGNFVSDGNLVTEFCEKDQMKTDRINGGFFVLHKSIFSYFSPEVSLNFERDVLPKIAADQNLGMFPHDGYWQCMDTQRDMEYLNREWESGNAPWAVWNRGTTVDPQQKVIGVRDTLWTGRSVLVTGASGFLGSWLTMTLAQNGARVVALDRKTAFTSPDSVYGQKTEGSIDFVSGDVRDKDLLQALFLKYDFETVFHLAAVTIVGEAISIPNETIDINVRGTTTLIEVFRTFGTRHEKRELIIASTDKAYGTHTELPYTEQNELKGNDHPYDLSKNCADRISLMYASLYKVPITVTRCANIFGGGDTNFSRLIPDLIRSLYTNSPFTIRSDGSYQRDYLYVEDAVNGYLKLAEKMHKEGIGGRAYNFGNNSPKKVIDVVHTITHLMQKSVANIRIANEAQHEIRDQYLDSTKARLELGWEPRHTLESGLEKTIRWYGQYLKERGELR